MTPILVYALCTCCRTARPLPSTHPGAHGAKWICGWCSFDTERWVAREMARR